METCAFEANACHKNSSAIRIIETLMTLKISERIKGTLILDQKFGVPKEILQNIFIYLRNNIYQCI